MGTEKVGVGDGSGVGEVGETEKPVLANEDDG